MFVTRQIVTEDMTETARRQADYFNSLLDDFGVSRLFVADPATVQLTNNSGRDIIGG